MCFLFIEQEYAKIDFVALDGPEVEVPVEGVPAEQTAVVAA